MIEVDQTVATVKITGKGRRLLIADCGLWIADYGLKNRQAVAMSCEIQISQ
jgi:hypothetical protein